MAKRTAATTASTQGVLDVPARPSALRILELLEELTDIELEQFGAEGAGDARPLPAWPAPRRTVTTRCPVTRENAARRVKVRPDLELSRSVRNLWDEGIQESWDLARRLILLAPAWMERDLPGADPLEVEAEDLAVATSLRCAVGAARASIRDAHRAIDLLPLGAQALEEGSFPASWFTQLLERTRELTDDEMLIVDTTIATWSLAITPEVFTRELKALVTELLAERKRPPHLEPEARRRMILTPGEQAGTACLRIIGPIPEVAALARQYDETARAVQEGQRQALRDGTEIPCDPDGQVEREGMPLSLALIRYHLAQGATLDSHGTEVPAERFRMNVLMPFLSMMGGDTSPATMDGTPIPADMARELAGRSEEWFRVLTDPSSGEFLPRPADRYRPTHAMLEHLRLRGGTCAVPGCHRSTSVASEADHIIEYDHADPAAGGQTEIGNLHLLCWEHHALKIAGLLDPERVSGEDSPTDRRGTRWSIREQIRVFREDDTDLTSPRVVAELTRLWNDLEARRAEHEHQDTQPGPVIAPWATDDPEPAEREVGWRESVRSAPGEGWLIEPEPPPRYGSRMRRPEGDGDPADPGPPPF